MKRAVYIIIGVGTIMFGNASEVFAQSVTYNHDDAKMNQITVAEIGSGSLTPSLYYQLCCTNPIRRVRRQRTSWAFARRRVSTCTIKWTMPKRWIQP